MSEEPKYYQVWLDSEQRHAMSFERWLQYCLQDASGRIAQLEAENAELRKDNLKLVNSLELEGARLEMLARELCELRKAVNAVREEAYEAARATRPYPLSPLRILSLTDAAVEQTVTKL